MAGGRTWPIAADAQRVACAIRIDPEELRIRRGGRLERDRLFVRLAEGAGHQLLVAADEIGAAFLRDLEFVGLFGRVAHAVRRADGQRAAMQDQRGAFLKFLQSKPFTPDDDAQ